MSISKKIIFNFESKLKQLVLRINSITSIVDETDFKFKQTDNSDTGNVISCQIVNFNFEHESLNHYQVYNFCHQLQCYEDKLKEYFSKTDQNGYYINKSILSIHKEQNDDRIWYSEFDQHPLDKDIELELEYRQPDPTTAIYEKYKSVAASKIQWDNWCNLMREIYPNYTVSVFCKILGIPISDSNILYSGIFLTLSCKLTFTQIGIIGNICETLLNEIAFKDLLPSLYKNIEIQATRAAISQVMARNMSHNIGSHVMNKLITGVKNTDWTDTKYTSLINVDLTEKLLIEADNDKNIIDQLTIFNDYMRCRMDYLADIALGTPVMQYGRSVKDVMQELDKVRLLLENISGLSDFKYEIQCDNAEKYVVAMPNNVLGCQAFYNIIENIIRNTAKHGGSKTKIIFEVKINEICDNALKKYENDLYEVTVCDNVTVTDNELAEKQNLKIKGKIIGDDYKLRHGSLGMAEMKASAAYLRKVSLSLIDSVNIEPPLLIAFINENNKLGYKFYFRKPKMVLYVIKDIGEQMLNNELIKNGIELLSGDDFKNKLNDGMIFDHNFIVYEDDEIVQLIEKDVNKSSLPLRCYKQETINIKCINERAAEFEKLLEEIWKGWLLSREIPTEFDVSNVLPEDVVETGNGLLNKQNILCFENHNESLVINVVNKLLANHITISDLIKSNIFSEPLSGLGQRQLPYYEYRPHLIAINEDESIDYVKKVNDDDVKRYLTYICMSNDSYKGNLDDLNILRNKYSNLILFQLIEAATTRILVIDERIQEYAESEENFRKLMKLVNIIIPEKMDPPKDDNKTCSMRELYPIMDLSDNNLKDKHQKIINAIDQWILDDKTNILVLHYGILERLAADDKSTFINSILKKWAEKCNVVVTSGRGSYFELPSYVRFINLSNIHNAFIEIKNKYYITAVLNASRKKGD